MILTVSRPQFSLPEDWLWVSVGLIVKSSDANSPLLVSVKPGVSKDNE